MVAGRLAGWLAGWLSGLCVDASLCPPFPVQDFLEALQAANQSWVPIVAPGIKVDPGELLWWHRSWCCCCCCYAAAAAAAAAPAMAAAASHSSSDAAAAVAAALPVWPCAHPPLVQTSLPTWRASSRTCS